MTKARYVNSLKSYEIVLGRLRHTVFLGGFLLLCCFVTSSSATCIQSKVGSSCSSDSDCFQFDERHLYCNKTHGANVCAFQVQTYASQSYELKDCPGEVFSAEPWSNPISDDWISNSLGVDCLRLCFLTETCFAITIRESRCYLKNEQCFTNLQASQALFAVLSVTREDYHCGCHYPFTRRSSKGEILSWDSDCPESQLDRNPYRCCSEKGLCVKCENDMTPRPRSFYDDQAKQGRKQHTITEQINDSSLLRTR
ncbi:hypothetical protein Ocin01_00718 [Orchesella cincta]|uniref:Uncharacterized protein n=1 Tax=Orchesella cincta TaxID=48709 RepID=A0A1D2NLA3_ORCCI|nr:hypothetical protein Ocin01_00718 [Orchesella cincta]